MNNKTQDLKKSLEDFFGEPKEKKKARLSIWKWMPTARRIRKEFEND